jgi:long-chain fatty acid transport protein
MLGVCATQAALASGFAVPELSTAGIGTANALVANPDERGAVAYNPAAMAFHDQSFVSAGLLSIKPDFSVDIPGAGGASNGADWIVAPMIQAAIRIDERWSAGVSVNAPFGLETRWPVNTFPTLTETLALPTPPFAPGTTVEARPQPTQSKLEILNIAPTLTYSVSPELALSAGFDIYWAKSAQLNSSLTALDGDGTGFGFNLSALYVRDRFSIGGNFRSAPTVNIDGTYEMLNPDLVRFGLADPSQTAELDVRLPWRLQLGARYEVIEDRFAVEIDWTRTGWSEFKEIKVTGDLSGATLIDDQNRWEDANAYRLGITYDLDEVTQLRLGYSYDETGQPDQYFSARVPDSDRNLFGIGLRRTFADGWQVEAGYMYASFDDRRYRADRAYDPRHPGEINGTSALNGDYEASAHLFGLEISKGFDAF